MKVLSEKSKWSTEVTCRECKSQLEIGQDDLVAVNTAMAYAGESFEPRVKVKCEVCESSIDVTDKLTSGIRNKLFEALSQKLNNK